MARSPTRLAGGKLRPVEWPCPSNYAGANRCACPRRMMNPLSTDVRALVCCPICRGDIRHEAVEWQCTADGCRGRFPVVNGVPILVNEANSLFTIADFLERKPVYFRPVGRARRWISARLPTESHNLAATRVLTNMRDQLRNRSGRSKVLVI